MSVSPSVLHNYLMPKEMSSCKPSSKRWATDHTETDDAGGERSLTADTRVANERENDSNLTCVPVLILGCMIFSVSSSRSQSFAVIFKANTRCRQRYDD